MWLYDDNWTEWGVMGMDAEEYQWTGRERMCFEKLPHVWTNQLLQVGLTLTCTTINHSWHFVALAFATIFTRDNNVFIKLFQTHYFSGSWQPRYGEVISVPHTLGILHEDNDPTYKSAVARVTETLPWPTEENYLRFQGISSASIHPTPTPSCGSTPIQKATGLSRLCPVEKIWGFTVLYKTTFKTGLKTQINEKTSQGSL